MKLEHFALNVAQPKEVAQWYVEHLGMTVVSAQDVSPFAHFLTDNSGRVMIEIYENHEASIPIYAEMNPLIVHIAFVSDDPTADTLRLVNAGATVVSDSKSNDGTHLVMLRDPWGLALQLCKRSKPLLKKNEQSS